MKKLIAMTATAVVLSGAAYAAPVDLTGWAENGRPNNGAGTWTVQPGNDSVIQSRNGNPTVFYDATVAGANAQGKQLSGSIEVLTGGDDDFIGFVLGYQANEINSTNADFWLIDWKQNDQNPAVDGLALSHVSGDLTGTSGSGTGGWWNHAAPINEVARGINLGSTGWNDLQEYNFDLTFTNNLIEVFVDGVLEISYSSATHGSLFTDGAFGFYNFSQSQVKYAGITEDTLPPVPLPAGLPLLLAGLGAFGLMRRRQA
ncbi:VPLPA-CTERM sorting domain-containing protein [Tateyamaria armeniaca]|uniref:VPLPA-CTERM sorting domain-containing protein n=1 Tax=Tateyamaria armeniaca TaxID=2518930 RepID=A0ABW8UT31_9RHOB